jgi:hypothetical protein
MKKNKIKVIISLIDKNFFDLYLNEECVCPLLNAEQARILTLGLETAMCHFGIGYKIVGGKLIDFAERR